MASKKPSNILCKSTSTPVGQPGTVCDVCGRPLPPRKGVHGRRRERHRECIIVHSRIQELIELVPKLRFAPPATTEGSNALKGHAKQLRAQLFALSRLLTSKTTQCATDDRDYYVKKTKTKRGG